MEEAGVTRRPIVGVMGSHRGAPADRARRLGAWIARRGCHLLTGGGAGVMEAVSEGFASVDERAGSVLAVVPCRPGDPRTPVPGYPNRWVEIPFYSQLDRGVPTGDAPMSRNHANILTSTVVVLLPGGDGTASEGRLALEYERPCIAYLRSRDELPGLPAGIPVVPELAGVVAFVEQVLREMEPNPS